MERAKKEQVVADLHQKLQRATGTILTDFKGLTVAEMTDLRTALAAEQVDFCVIKNTLMRLAIQDTSAAALQPLVQGTCAVAISYGDPAAPAKIIKKYLKTNEKLKIKGGAWANTSSPRRQWPHWRIYRRGTSFWANYWEP